MRVGLLLGVLSGWLCGCGLRAVDLLGMWRCVEHDVCAALIYAGALGNRSPERLAALTVLALAKGYGKLDAQQQVALAPLEVRTMPLKQIGDL